MRFVNRSYINKFKMKISRVCLNRSVVLVIRSFGNPFVSEASLAIEWMSTAAVRTNSCLSRRLSILPCLHLIHLGFTCNFSSIMIKILTPTTLRHNTFTSARSLCFNYQQRQLMTLCPILILIIPNLNVFLPLII